MVSPHIITTKERVNTSLLLFFMGITEFSGQDTYLDFFLGFRPGLFRRHKKHYCRFCRKRQENYRQGRRENPKF